MTVRTTEATVTFRHPFSLMSLGLAQPAGTYRVVTEEEEILGLSFIAFRRIATLLYIPALSISKGSNQIFAVSSTELAAALKADERA